MKLIIGTALVLGAFAIAALHAPHGSVAAVDHSPAPSVLVASTADEGEAAYTWVCDEPYGVFPTLKACRASGCTVQCGVNY
jgi:hypothetical protein